MNSNLRSLLIAGLVLAAGFGGYWLGSRRVPPARPTSPAVTDRVGQLQQENDRLRAERAQAEPPPAAHVAATAVPGTTQAGANASRFEQARVLAQVKKDKLASINLPVVGRDGKVADGFATLFALAETERQSLQQSVDQARRRVEELAAAGLTVTEEAGKLVFTVKPFEGGAEVYDTLMDAFARTLGPERNAAFLALQPDDLGNAFSGFGGEQRTVSFYRESSARTGEAMIMVTDQRKLPRGSVSSTTSNTDPAKITAQYPWLASYMPKIMELPVKARPPSGGPP